MVFGSEATAQVPPAAVIASYRNTSRATGQAVGKLPR